jgi:hypothetical protein
MIIIIIIIIIIIVISAKYFLSFILRGFELKYFLLYLKRV